MDEWVECYECEERDNCPEASKNDGCEFGIKTTKEDENE